MWIKEKFERELKKEKDLIEEDCEKRIENFRSKCEGEKLRLNREILSLKS
jgi:hypothetical protein